MSEVAADRPTDAEGVARWLERAGVVAVALPFVDPSAIVRVKTIPLGRFVQVADTGVGLSTLFNVAMSNDRFALRDGFIDGPSGDLRLRPDPAATVPLAAMPGWAWAPVDQYTQEGEPFAACPRAFATAMASRIDSSGLSVRAAFEPEFSVGARHEDGSFEPAHTGPGYSDIALVANHPFALDLIEAIEAQGLWLQQFHPEYADGQFELSIAPRDPVAAADAAMVLRQTVRAVARRHGWITSFAPRVEADTGNGSHLHLSLWEGERNLLSGGNRPGGMDPRGEAFMAGILAIAAGPGRDRGADRRQLPAAPAASLVGCDAVLGYRESRGRAPVHRGDDADDGGRGEHRGEAGRWSREPLPRRGGDARGRAGWPATRAPPATVDRGGSDASVAGDRSKRAACGSSPPRCPRLRSTSPRRPSCVRRWGSSCSRRSSRRDAARPRGTPTWMTTR